MTVVSDFEFIFGLYLLKLILFNTDTLSPRNNIDAAIAQKTANPVNAVLKGCHNGGYSNLVWKKCKEMRAIIW